jgi:MULE transposase domain
MESIISEKAKEGKSASKIREELQALNPEHEAPSVDQVRTILAREKNQKENAEEFLKSTKGVQLVSLSFKEEVAFLTVMCHTHVLQAYLRNAVDSKTGLVLIVDGTWGLAQRGLQTYVVGMLTRWGTTEPLAYAIMDRKTAFSYEQLFSTLKQLGVQPRFLLSDFEMATGIAARAVWGEDLVISKCVFHFMQANKRMLESCHGKRKNAWTSIKECLRGMYRAVSKEAFNMSLFALERVCGTENLNEYLQYFRQQWLTKEDPMEWTSIGIACKVLRGVRTTNGIERHNSFLKTTLFDGKSFQKIQKVVGGLLGHLLSRMGDLKANMRKNPNAAIFQSAIMNAEEEEEVAVHQRTEDNLRDRGLQFVAISGAENRCFWRAAAFQLNYGVTDDAALLVQRMVVEELRNNQQLRLELEHVLVEDQNLDLIANDFENGEQGDEIALRALAAATGRQVTVTFNTPDPQPMLQLPGDPLQDPIELVFTPIARREGDPLGRHDVGHWDTARLRQVGSQVEAAISEAGKKKRGQKRGPSRHANGFRALFAAAPEHNLAPPQRNLAPPRRNVAPPQRNLVPPQKKQKQTQQQAQEEQARARPQTRSQPPLQLVAPAPQMVAQVPQMAAVPEVPSQNPPEHSNANEVAAAVVAASAAIAIMCFVCSKEFQPAGRMRRIVCKTCNRNFHQQPTCSVTRKNRDGTWECQDCTWKRKKQ